MMAHVRLDPDLIADFCRRWKIVEMSLFGSVLRDDFGPRSDVDVLAQFAEDAPWTLLDHVRMQEELGALLGRKVDLVSRRGLDRTRNWLRKRAILDGARQIYAA